MEKKWDPRTIAIHEAGHAVAAWALGLELDRVTVAAGEPGATYDDADDALLGAQATAAGPIAQDLFTPRTPRPRMGWQNDRVQFWEYYLRLDGISCHDVIRRATALVKQHERHVRQLADELLERVEMPGAKVKAFLDEIE
jgi:hypothetical protein